MPFNFLSALIIAIGIAGAGWFVADGVITSREPLRTVTVKGLAERTVLADLGFWPVRFVATGPDLEQARASLERSEAAVRQFLEQRGFQDSEMKVQNITVEDRLAGYYNNPNPGDVRFVLTQDLLVTSANV